MPINLTNNDTMEKFNQECMLLETFMVDIINEIKVKVCIFFPNFTKDINSLNYRFNSRMRTTAGRAYFKQNLIELNLRLFLNLSDLEKKEVVIHEISHLISFQYFHHTAHGKPFKEVLKKLGAKNLSAFHSYNVQHLKNKTKLFKYYCGCETSESNTIGRIRYNRIMKGYKYRCKKCDFIIKLIE